MRKRLYVIIAGALLSAILLAKIFEEEVNSSPLLVIVGIFLVVGLIDIGAILLTLWDTKIASKKQRSKP